MSISAALAVLAKDVRCEIRSRQALSAVLLFAVTSTIAASFTLGALGHDATVAAILLWLVIYFSAMAGLGRSFAHEEETGTASLLRLSAPAESVYLGKLAFNFLTLACVEAVSVPLFLLLSGCQVSGVGWFVAVVVLGTLAISSGATTAAAMVSRASGRGALLAAVGFPLLAPALGVAIAGTNAALRGTAGVASDARILVYYSGIVIVASLMLFRYIWEE